MRHKKIPARRGMAAVVAVALAAAIPAAATHVTPTAVTGNKKCADLITGSYELKVEPLAAGSYTDGTLTVTISGVEDDRRFDWSSDIGVDGVIVKSGPGGNFYDYRPGEATSDTDLEGTTNPDNGKVHDISHVSFCYDAAVLAISKSASTSEAVSPGDKVTYTIKVSNTGNEAASSVTITDAIPTGTEFVSCSDSCTVTNGVATWSLTSLAGGASKSVTLTVKVLSSAGCTICNTARVSSPSYNDGTAIASDEVCLDVDEGRTEADSNAFGLVVAVAPIEPAFPGAGVGPAPDTDDADPADELASVSVPEGSDEPAAVAHLLRVADSASTGTTSAQATAVATVAEVGLLDQDPTAGEDFLVHAVGVRAVSSSFATGTSAGSSSAGSVIERLTIDGETYTNVTEPMTAVVETPSGAVVVSVLESTASGAKAGVPQPQDETFASALSVAAIHVRALGGEELAGATADITVARASSTAAFPSALDCGNVAPRVAGRAFSFGTTAGGGLVDPAGALAFGQLGLVVLPAAGGAEESTLPLGPVAAGGSTVAESDSAFNRTAGSIDIDDDEATADSESEIQELRLLDQDPDPAVEDFLITADLIRATSGSDAAGTSASSAGDTVIANLLVAGTDVCDALGVPDPGACHPEPNTLLLSQPGLVIVLNEQIADPSATGSSGLTVNAIRIIVVGPANELGLAVGTEIIIASASSGAASAGA